MKKNETFSQFASRIRKEGETWKEAQKRASKIIADQKAAASATEYRFVRTINVAGGFIPLALYASTVGKEVKIEFPGNVLKPKVFKNSIIPDAQLAQIKEQYKAAWRKSQEK